MAEEKKDEQPIVVKKIFKKGGHGGHHGGAWKVAYADFVTAMMALFLLLWLVNVDPSSKSAVSSYFSQPTQTGPMQGNVFIFGGAKRPGNPGRFEGGASFMEFQKLVLTGQNKEEVKELIKNEFKKELELETDKEVLQNVDFHLTDKGILIEIKDSDSLGLFGPGSSVLSPQAKKIIDNMSHVLQNKLSQIVVAGHTDSQEYGQGLYDNWNLSTDRAHAVKNRLVMSGLEKKRIARIEGYADTQPKNSDNTLDASNRRITITLLQSGEEENLAPNILDPKDKFDKQEKTQMIYESDVKSKKTKDVYFQTGSRDKAPPSLDELRRRKKRRSRPAPAAGGGGGH